MFLCALSMILYELCFYVGDVYKRQVLTTAAKYGYTPKSAPPASPSSRVIQLINYKKHGKIAADTPFFSQLTEGITQECRRQNCVLHISYFYENMDISAQLASLKEVDCIGILLLATEMQREDFKKFMCICFRKQPLDMGCL